MEPVAKKKRRAPAKHGRAILLVLAILALAGALAGSLLLRRPPVELPSVAPATPTLLFSYPAEEVHTIAVHLEGEDSWTVSLDESSGQFVLQGEDGFTLSQTTTQRLQDAAHTLTCESVLTEDPAEYAAHLEDFGLDTPSRIASITFRDGTVITVRIGDRAPHTAAWYYMTMDHDERLFALSSGMVNALFVSRESLWDVTQPVIHKARIDRITLRGSNGDTQAEWVLQGAIDDSDALDHWQITHPFVYPAAAESMRTMLSNAANLRLGAYVAPATAENLTLYGFDEPRMSIELHMAAGAIGATNEDGAFTAQEWPESTVLLIIGGQRSDLVDYVRYGDSIFVSSHFTVGVFLDVNPLNSMNRYPVLTALGNLHSLTIEQDGAITRYDLTRTEQVLPNNEIATDLDGNTLYTTTVTKNGTEISFTAFEAAYEQLITVSVADVLAEDAIVAQAPHSVYSFADVNGTVHTIALSSYGVMHDAVSVDGHQAFYIEKGKLQLGLE